MTRIIVLLLFITLSAKGQTVYKTPHGECYHIGSCRMVENVSSELTLEKAHALGLRACKICKPPQNGTAFNIQNNARGENVTVQCMGITKKGNRCKHMTSIANGYCFQHNPDR